MVTDYFKIQALEALTLEHHNYMNVQLAYRIDGGSEWHSLDDVNGDVYLDSGQTIEYQGNNYKLGGDGDGFSITSDGLVNISGNLYSLLDDTNFSGITSLAGYDTETFRQLFYWDNGEVLRVVDASGLELPATTLAERCYERMFADCTSLVSAPELPATTLATLCYYSMFYGCTNLTTAPALPATTLVSGCYSSMFYGCTNLTTAPSILPATTLAEWCYDNMFRDCTSLVSAPELPTTTLVSTCYQYMFADCTSLVSAPELPATTLVPYCYQYMFNNCSNLKYIKCLATNISASNCTRNWVNGVASTGTFAKPASTDWSSKTGINGIPTGWTVVVPGPTIEAAYVGSDEVNKIYKGSNVIYEKTGPTPIDYRTVPLTFEVISGGTITWKKAGSSAANKTIQYSKNGGAWTSITASDTTGISITVNAGDVVQFMGNNSQYATNYFGDACKFDMTAKCYVYGNIMSLINATDFANLTTLSSKNTFAGLFFSCSNLYTNTKPLLLPATTLAQACYSNMFQGCSSLTTAPELPATTLVNACYASMFRGCTNLTTAPELPATTLIDGCYQLMFFDCSNLNSIKCLATDISASYCTNSWVNGVQTNSGTFVCPSSTDWSSKTGTSGIPTNWARVNA